MSRSHLLVFQLQKKSRLKKKNSLFSACRKKSQLSWSEKQFSMWGKEEFFCSKSIRFFPLLCSFVSLFPFPLSFFFSIGVTFGGDFLGCRINEEKQSRAFTLVREYSRSRFSRRHTVNETSCSMCTFLLVCRYDLLTGFHCTQRKMGRKMSSAFLRLDFFLSA